MTPSHIVFNEDQSWQFLCGSHTSYLMLHIAPATKNDVPNYEKKMCWDNGSSMIRTRTGHLASARSLRLFFRTLVMHFVWQITTTFRAQLYLPKFQQILRLPRKVTLQHHQILHLPRKVVYSNITKCCPCHEKGKSNIACQGKEHYTSLKYFLTELLLDRTSQRKFRSLTSENIDRWKTEQRSRVRRT